MKTYNGKNAEITSLINRGKKSMMNYYDTQYRNIIKEAQRMVSLQNYEEALAMVLSIPICSKGGEEASR
jgi:type III secretory pathway component EscV